ncbi:MAG TPA: POTRA domain-containing protein, partial [Sphingomicrobium sp.]|nr:POTRA domain-containing protein [Sphingomicrobium sp.]
MAFAVSPPEPAAIERTIPTQLQQRSLAPVVSVPARERRDQRASERRFTLGAVTIDGATVFTQEQLSRYFEPYLATEVDQGKLVRVADAITARYRQTGYLLSYAMVPSQSVESGMVRMSVIEGRIGDVSVEGAGTAKSAIEAIAKPLTKDGPVRTGELERTIGLIRDFPGVSVTDVALMRSDVQPGLYSLRIKVAPDRIR